MFKTTKIKWQSIRAPYWFYICGTVFGGVFLAAELANKKTSLISAISMWMYFGLFAIGFVLWISPGLRRVWRTSYGKLLIYLSHAAILFIAVIPSRWLVANALGLPPQDFDITVSVFAVELYFPLWLLSMAFGSLLLFTLLSLSWLFIVILGAVGGFFCSFLPVQSRTRTFIDVMSSLELRYMGHATGAAFVSVLASVA